MVLIVKLADRLHNMRTKVAETISLYVPIARFLKMYEAADELRLLSEKYL